MADFLNTRAAEQEEHHWLSVSDLMAGLLIVFLFIAIALMRNAYLEKERIQNIAVAYQETQVALYEELMSEFEQDLGRWQASIDADTLTFTFNAPDVLFEQGRYEVNAQYRNLLGDFFPRYMAVLDQFRDTIDEVRIEGHTSSDWGQNVTADVAYFLNMQLSQDRTRSVLNYVYGLPEVEAYRPWIKTHVAAVGFSSSRAILRDDGVEDGGASRRVTFRVITNSEIQIKQILESAQ